MYIIIYKKSIYILGLKQRWWKDTMAWLNHWSINENDIFQNIDNVKNIITSKFKEKFWCEENLALKRKLKYCVGHK